MSVKVTIAVSGYQGTTEDLAKLLLTMPGVVSARPLVDPTLKLPTASHESPPEAIERADSWLREVRAGAHFVASEFGDVTLGGQKGYFAGGPGLSAMTIYNFFRRDPETIRATEPFPHHPEDVEDLTRCMKLFERVPEWRSRIDELTVLSPAWGRFVYRWEELEHAVISENSDTILLTIKDCTGQS